MSRLSPEARERAQRLADTLGPDGSLQLALLLQEVTGTGTESALDVALRSVEAQDILYAVALPQREPEEEPSWPRP